MRWIPNLTFPLFEFVRSKKNGKMEQNCSKNRAKSVFICVLLITVPQIGFVAIRFIENSILGSLVLLICFIPSVVGVFYFYGKWMSNVNEERRSSSGPQTNFQICSISHHSNPNHLIYSITMTEIDNSSYVQNSQNRPSPSEAFNINTETRDTSCQSTSDYGPPPSYSQLNNINQSPPSYEAALDSGKDVKWIMSKGF